MKKYILYKIARPIIKTFMNITFRIEVGNHTSYLDPLLLISSTKRTIRFLAKKEIHKGILKNIFISAGTIPVDRSKKDKNAKIKTKEALLNKELVCIFPEGTINRTKDLILPFKYGTVSFASITNTDIIPFIITGKYKLFQKNIKIKFLPPYKIQTQDLKKENENLMEIIKKELGGTTNG